MELLAIWRLPDRSASCLACVRMCVRNPTRDQHHVNCLCVAFLSSLFLSILPSSHFHRHPCSPPSLSHYLASFWAQPLVLGPRWPPHTLDFDSGASSAVVPPVGTYAQASFTALFRDTSVACTGDGQSVAGARAAGDTLFVLAFGSHLFLVPCLV